MLIVQHSILQPDCECFPNAVAVGPQSELTGREVSLHNQKLALESVMKELQDTKQTIDRFRCALFFSWSTYVA